MPFVYNLQPLPLSCLHQQKMKKFYFAGYHSFLRHLKELETAIQDPGGLATDLYSHGLIDKMTWEKASLVSVSRLERSRELLGKLDGRLKANEAAYDTLLSILDRDPNMKDVCDTLNATKGKLEITKNPKEIKATPIRKAKSLRPSYLMICLIMPMLAYLWDNMNCYQVGLCYSKSLPSVDHFVGREEDIHNITGYLDFTSSDVQIVHIVGPPGFGKSTLAMKIGDMLMRKWVHVYYVDLRTVKNINSMAEKVLEEVHTSENKTLSSLKTWISNQGSKILIILDNCNDLFKVARKEFISATNVLISASPRKNVRYILTSHDWIASFDDYSPTSTRLHATSSLSPKAAIKLLNMVAFSLSVDDCKKLPIIAHLTGCVPLALKVVGAVLNLPDPPSVDTVIESMVNNNLNMTAGRDDEVPSVVNVSIGIAFSYLPPELKQLCVNISHFPGSFDVYTATDIFNFNLKLLYKLADRSLLQTSHGRQRFNLHPLIRTYCLCQDSMWSYSHKQEFDFKFQIHFIIVIDNLFEDDINGRKLKNLSEESMKIQHMLFTLFNTANDARIRKLQIDIDKLLSFVLTILNNQSSHRAIEQIKLFYCKFAIARDYLDILQNTIGRREKKDGMFTSDQDYLHLPLASYKC